MSDRSDTRAHQLAAAVTRYRERAAENYVRVRTLAEALRDGFCAYLHSNDPPCVHLAPPLGPFEGKDYGDRAFSAPPVGFQTLGPIAFGLIVRVSSQNDWLRLVLTCAKEGQDFIVEIEDGPSHTFTLPLQPGDYTAFFELVFEHVKGWFERETERYDAGDYGSRAIGFDVIAGSEAPLTPKPP